MHSPDNETTSYRKGLENMFRQMFPEDLSPEQYLFIINQANPDSAEFLEERLGLSDMQGGREAELRKWLEVVTITEWANSGIDTFNGVTRPVPEVHTPSKRVYLERRGRQRVPSAHSPPHSRLSKAS